MTSVVAQGFVSTQYFFKTLPVVLEDLKPAFGQSQEYAIYVKLMQIFLSNVVLILVLNYC